ncbi:UbiD family decarboxylase [Penicillium antarcticum]|nr:UbiD family decarboxylase [Penicillium antarcticum]KAJ5301810.1 UbiD family decarboxylase [Penicillium antarcticum]
MQQKWKAIGKDVPWALVFGVPTAAIMISSMPLPDGCTEAVYIEATTDHAIDVANCWFGYVLPGDTHTCLLYKDNKITYRNKAILPVSNCGRLTNETTTSAEFSQNIDNLVLNHKAGYTIHRLVLVGED